MRKSNWKIRTVGTGATALFLTGALFAVEPWEEKPYTEWTREEIAQVIFESPWATQIRVFIGGGFRDAAALARGAGGAGGAGAADRWADPENRGVPVTVRWHSALPIREALAAQMLLQGEGKLDERWQRFLDEDPQFYDIAVAGLPPTMAAAVEDAEAVKAGASLKVKGMGELKPEDVQVRSNAEGVEIIYRFPRETAVTAEQKEAAFEAELKREGGSKASIKHKFKPQEMVYKGETAL